MRILPALLKTFRENVRDWKILIIALVFAPFFIYLTYGYLEASSPSFTLAVVDHDRGERSGTSPSQAAQALLETWRAARYPDGSPVFVIVTATDLGEARAKLASRDADLVIEIPPGFAGALDAARDDPGAPPALLRNHGSTGDPRSGMAMALSDYYAYTYVSSVTGIALPLDIENIPLGPTRTERDFDLYVPGLLVAALVLILFTAAATLIKEVDKGTMIRLRLSPLGTTEYLLAVTLNQVLLGIAALGLAYLAAWSVGYRSDGSLIAVLTVGAVSTLGIVAVGILVASFLRTIFELLTVGVVPFFILLFFSECMFPLPKVPLAALAGHTLYINDVLPTALTVRALGKILHFGAGLSDVRFEIGVTSALTIAYFALGLFLFRRRHQRA